MLATVAMRTRPAAGQTWPGWVIACAAILGVFFGCTTARTVSGSSIPASAEFLEFANMRQSNRVPKSTGAALVGAFERFCLDTGRGAAAIASALRRADYVAAPRNEGDVMTAFVVDDRRPMVQVADNGQFCAVVAEARTGQSARIQRLMVHQFSGAQAVGIPGALDEFTLRVPGGGAFVALRRLASTNARSRLILAIQHVS